MKSKKICIGVDSFGLNHGMSGGGAYLLELLTNIVCDGNEHIELCVFGHELDRYTYTFSNAHFIGINTADNPLADLFWHKTQLNSFIKSHNFQAMLYVSGFRFLPLSFTVPSFLLVNEIPKEVNFFASLYFKHVIERVRGFIVPSRYIQDALLEFGVPQYKIAIIFDGVNRNIFTPLSFESEEVLRLQPFAIKRPYIIYASSLSSIDKCHIELIKAFNIFKKTKGAPHRLVLAGHEGQMTEMVRNEVLHSHYAQDILLTGYFPHESLNRLYAAADVCIFPSRKEGSVFPILEAMASGVPTACSGEGALREVAEEATLYFDSTNPDSIATSIQSLVKCPENEEIRSRLIKCGLECARKHSWKKTADETLAYLLAKL